MSINLWKACVIRERLPAITDMCWLCMWIGIAEQMHVYLWKCVNFMFALACVRTRKSAYWKEGDNRLCYARNHRAPLSAVTSWRLPLKMTSRFSTTSTSINNFDTKQIQHFSVSSTLKQIISNHTFSYLYLQYELITYSFLILIYYVKDHIWNHICWIWSSNVKMGNRINW